MQSLEQARCDFVSGSGCLPVVGTSKGRAAAAKMRSAERQQRGDIFKGNIPRYGRCENTSAKHC